MYFVKGTMLTNAKRGSEGFVLTVPSCVPCAEAGVGLRSQARVQKDARASDQLQEDTAWSPPLLLSKDFRRDP